MTNRPALILEIKTSDLVRIHAGSLVGTKFIQKFNKHMDRVSFGDDGAPGWSYAVKRERVEALASFVKAQTGAAAIWFNSKQEVGA